MFKNKKNIQENKKKYIYQETNINHRKHALDDYKINSIYNLCFVFLMCVYLIAFVGEFFLDPFCVKVANLLVAKNLINVSISELISIGAACLIEISICTIIVEKIIKKTIKQHKDSSDIVLKHAFVKYSITSGIISLILLFIAIVLIFKYNGFFSIDISSLIDNLPYVYNRFVTYIVTCIMFTLYVALIIYLDMILEISRIEKKRKRMSEVMFHSPDDKKHIYDKKNLGIEYDTDLDSYVDISSEEYQNLEIDTVLKRQRRR